MAHITPAIREICRQELIKVCPLEYAKQVEEVLWQWSRGFVPNLSPVQAVVSVPTSSKSVSSSSSSSSSASANKKRKKDDDANLETKSNKNKKQKVTRKKEDSTTNDDPRGAGLENALDAHILYEGKFKQLLHNLQINRDFLIEKYTPDTLIWLDDACLAESTEFVSLREEMTKRDKRLQEIIDASKTVAPAPVINVASNATFLRCRCGSTDIQFNQKQTRGGDEGMTNFCNCTACGNTWKMS